MSVQQKSPATEPKSYKAEKIASMITLERHGKKPSDNSYVKKNRHSVYLF